MSGIVHKVEEAIHKVTHPKDKEHGTTTGSAVPEGTVGPHSSRTANAADPRVDSDLDNHHARHGTTTTGVGGTSATHAGATTHTGTSHNSTTAGPHKSDLLNKMDPRVDSDLDGSRNAGLNKTTASTGHTTVHTTGHTTGHTATTSGIGATTGSTNAGPHNSNILNQADPRVDSDLDHSRNAGLNQTTRTSGHTGTTGTTGAGIGSTGSTNAGPHNSNLLNKMDPRVDSDLDRSRNAGMNQTTGHVGHTGTTGHVGHTGTSTVGTTGVAGTAGSTNAGPHNSNLLNKMDPRVDSDLDRSRNAGMNQTTGPAGYTGTSATGTVGATGSTGSTNAGPHNSNLLNKMDPRVDSDLDASRNAGLNQTTRTGY